MKSILINDLHRETPKECPYKVIKYLYDKYNTFSKFCIL